MKERIEKKVLNAERINEKEALFLFEQQDLIWLGRLANAVKERLSGPRVFFNINRHINPTNFCVNRCRFCAFSASLGDKHGYQLSPEDIAKIADETGKVYEFHIVGGLHPEWDFEYYLDILSLLSKKRPEALLQAYTAVEIDHFSKISGLTLQKTIAELKKAGLDAVPGGGAEIFDTKVRNKICPEKISSRRWLQVHEALHKAGVQSNATMLYGHVEKFEHRVDHMKRLRALQDRTHGFAAFIPLAFHPKNTRMALGHYTTGVDDLKTIAVSRIYLDNFPHIKAFWIMLGEKLAQISLWFGADDLDGTVEEEKITHMAGAQTPEALAKDELVRLIREAGRKPIERDTFYQVKKIW
jgi:aminodeoxyfutalosine synthase